MAKTGEDGGDLAFERESRDDGVAVEVVTGEDVPFCHVGVRDTDSFVEGCGPLTRLVTWEGRE